MMSDIKATGNKFLDGDIVLWNNQTYQILYSINKNYTILHLDKTYEELDGPTLDKEYIEGQKTKYKRHIDNIHSSMNNQIYKFLSNVFNINITKIEPEWIPIYKKNDYINMDKMIIKIDLERKKYVLFNPIIYEIDSHTLEIMAVKDSPFIHSNHKNENSKTRKVSKTK